MQSHIKIGQRRVVDMIKRNPDGSLDFRDMQGEPMALSLAIGRRCYEMSRYSRVETSFASVADVQLAAMMMGVVYLTRGKRYDLRACLESDPFTFWDEMRLIATHIIMKPIAWFPESVRLRFAQTSALH